MATTIILPFNTRLRGDSETLAQRLTRLENLFISSETTSNSGTLQFIYTGTSDETTTTTQSLGTSALAVIIQNYAGMTAAAQTAGQRILFPREPKTAAIDGGGFGWVTIATDEYTVVGVKIE